MGNKAGGKAISKSTILIEMFRTTLMAMIVADLDSNGMNGLIRRRMYNPDTYYFGSRVVIMTLSDLALNLTGI